jgi:hypothetical protein
MMRSEEASSQPQHPVKFRSFPSSSRLMNSNATGGRDLISFQCKTGQRLHKWSLNKWPCIPSFVFVKDRENYKMRTFASYTLQQVLLVVRDGREIHPALGDPCPTRCKWDIILKWIINKWGVEGEIDVHSSRQGVAVDSFNHSNVSTCSLKVGIIWEPIKNLRWSIFRTIC